MPKKPSEDALHCFNERRSGQSYKNIAKALNTPNEKQPQGGDWTEAKVRDAVQSVLSYERSKSRLQGAIDHDAKVFDTFEVDKTTGTVFCVHSSHTKGSVDVYRYPNTSKDSYGLLDALEALRRHNYEKHGVV